MCKFSLIEEYVNTVRSRQNCPGVNLVAEELGHTFDYSRIADLHSVYLLLLQDLNAYKKARANFCLRRHAIL